MNLPWQGPRRFVVGRLNGVHAEPGTILGPKDGLNGPIVGPGADLRGEFLVVIAQDEDGVTLGYASADDLREAAHHQPRSLTEFRLTQFARQAVL